MQALEWGMLQGRGFEPSLLGYKSKPCLGRKKKGRKENVGKEGEVGRQIGELRFSEGPKFSLCSLESSPGKGLSGDTDQYTDKTVRPLSQALLRLSCSGKGRASPPIYANAQESTRQADDACLGRGVKILHGILFLKTVPKQRKIIRSSRSHDVRPRLQGPRKPRHGMFPLSPLPQTPGLPYPGPSGGTTLAVRPPCASSDHTSVGIRKWEYSALYGGHGGPGMPDKGACEVFTSRLPRSGGQKRRLS